MVEIDFLQGCCQQHIIKRAESPRPLSLVHRTLHEVLAPKKQLLQNIHISEMKFEKKMFETKKFLVKFHTRQYRTIQPGSKF